MTRLTDERLRWFLRDDVSPASPEVIPMARELLLLRAFAHCFKCLNGDLDLER